MHILVVMNRPRFVDFRRIFVLNTATLQDLSVKNSTMSSDNLDIFFDLLETNNILHNLHVHRIVVGPTFFCARNLIPFIARLIIDQIDANCNSSWPNILYLQSGSVGQC